MNSSKNANITFGKLIYRGQHAYFLHKINDLGACPDPVQEALNVAKRKKLRVLDFEVLGNGSPVLLQKTRGDDGFMKEEWVPAKLAQKDAGTGHIIYEWVKAEAHERIILVKCMAPRS